MRPLLGSTRPLLLLAFALVAPTGLLAAPAGAPDPDAAGLDLAARFEALLERVKHEQKGLISLEASFEQVKSSEFLAGPETSRGTLSFASPDRVRWEYREPKPISLVITDEVMVTWYRDLGRADRVQVGRFSSQVFQYLNASGSLESLLRYFRATVAFPKSNEPYRIELEPRFARVAKRLRSMTLWIDRGVFLPVRVRYEEPNGDVTEYRLADLKVNAPLPAERFVLDLPAEVEVREIDLEGGNGGRPTAGAAN